MNATMMKIRCLATSVMLLVTAAAFYQESFAYTASPSLLTDRTNRDGGSGCGDCHNGAKDASVEGGTAGLRERPRDGEEAADGTEGDGGERGLLSPSPPPPRRLLRTVGLRCGITHWVIDQIG